MGQRYQATMARYRLRRSDDRVLPSLDTFHVWAVTFLRGPRYVGDLNWRVIEK